MSKEPYLTEAILRIMDEAVAVRMETGLTPRKIYNELVILKERYTNQVGITEMEIEKLKKALTKALQALQAYVNKFGHCGNVYEQAQKALAAKEAGVTERRCGNCIYWMTRSCTPEKKFGQFKTCNSPGCSDFTLCPIRKEVGKALQRALEEEEGDNG